MLRPFKFQVVAVLLEEDEDGNVIGEKAAEPVVLYGLEALSAYSDQFANELAQINQET